jgi:CheY-like chemotaxis protein
MSCTSLVLHVAVYHVGRCLEAGFDAWLAKPFRVEDLVKVMADSQQRLQQKALQHPLAAAAAAAAAGPKQ